MSLGMILLIILLFLLIGGHFGAGWGNGPSGIVGILLIVLLVLVLTGRL